MRKDNRPFRTYGCGPFPRVEPPGYFQSSLRDLTALLRRLHPRAQDLGDAPRLGDATARRERRFGVEHFVDRTDAALVEVRDEAFEKSPRAGVILLVHFQPRIDERPDQ